jgi:uncharacterized peroxidase-related enzyme
MSRITVPAVDTATGATAEVYAKVRKRTGGKLPNAYAAMGYISPSLLTTYLDADAAQNTSGLSRKDLETIKLLVSAHSGCDYCVAAHNMMGKLAGFGEDEVRAIRHLEGTGDAKHDALTRFVLAILRQSGTLPDDVVADIRAAGYTDAQLLAIAYAIAMITFTNTFNRINDTEVDFPAVE